MEIIRDAADWKCSEHLENAIKAVDAILTRGDDPVSRTLKDWLKGLFGLKDLEHDEDFASVIEVCPQMVFEVKRADKEIGLVAAVVLASEELGSCYWQHQV